MKMNFPTLVQNANKIIAIVEITTEHNLGITDTTTRNRIVGSKPFHGLTGFCQSKL